MIDVQYIFNRVVKDLARKNQSGYSSTDEFNRDLIDSQNMLYEYYYLQFQKSQKISDALMPFLVELTLPIEYGYVSYPQDHRHPLEMSFKKIVNNYCGMPIELQIPMDYLNANEERDTLRSYIRKPDMEKEVMYYLQVNKKLKLHPMDLVGSVAYKYLREPKYGKYATTIDVVSATEKFDATKSVNLEWESQEATNIINLMLMLKGISVRDTELIQFASTKMQVEGYKIGGAQNG